MSFVINHLDVNDPCGRTHPGGMVILSGDAPVWKYCNLFHQCVTMGAGVIAIAHGIDTKTNSDASVVAYSVSEEYRIGQTIGRCRVPLSGKETFGRFVEKYGMAEGLDRWQAGEEPP